MTWLYKDKEVKELPKDCEAFVYLITNTTNGMMYVGKKLANSKPQRNHSKVEKIREEAQKKVTGKPIGVLLKD